MITAGIITRVSTAAQATDEHRSLELQLARTRDYADRNGYSVTAVFEIPGESAFADDLARRPQFLAAIEAAERGEFAMLLIYDMSRLARDQAVFHDVLRRLRRVGCRLIGVTTGMDYTDRKNGMFAAIEGGQHEAYSVNLGNRIADSKRDLFEKGLLVGSVPFGYERPLLTITGGVTIRDTKAPLLIIEPEADALRWAFAAIASGTAGYADVAREFNRRGLRPRSRQGYDYFTESAVQSLIENPTYAGQVIHHGETRPGIHPAIIDPAVFAAVQSRRSQGTRRPRSEALLTGLARCMYCGRPINSSSGAKARYYRERRVGRVNECPGTWGGAWRLEEPERQVETALRAVAIDPAFVAWLDSEERRVVVEHEESPAYLFLIGKRERIAESYMRGDIPRETRDAWFRDVDAEIAALPTQERVAVVSMRPSVRDYATVWDMAHAPERRAIAREMLQVVHMDLMNRELQMLPNEPWRDLFALRCEYVKAVRYVPPAGTGGRKRSVRMYRPEELIGAA